jgi:hypothetical protein
LPGATVKLAIFDVKLRIDFVKLTIIIEELHIFNICKVIYRYREVSKLILFVIKLPTTITYPVFKVAQFFPIDLFIKIGLFCMLRYAHQNHEFAYLCLKK